METYPHPTPEGIIDLVRQTEYDRLKWELDEAKTKLKTTQKLLADANRGAERNAKVNWGLAGHVNEARAELAKWQSLARQLAEVLNNLSHDCTNHSKDIQNIRWGNDGDCGAKLSAEQIEECCNAANEALAAYESATATTGKPETAQ